MTTAELSHDEPSKRERYSRCRDHDRGVWTPVNIALMVLGFIFFTPIGLIILFGLIAGVSPMQLPGKIMSWFEGASEQFSSMRSTHSRSRTRSGNAVFDEYQQTQLDRIDEIRAEVRDRDHRFTSFKDEEKRGKDKKQFDRFMGRDHDDEA